MRFQISDFRFQNGATWGRVLWVMLCLFAWVGAVEGAPAAFVLRGGERKVELPPLAEVQYRNVSGKTWAAMGKISGSLEIAKSDFGICLSRQGWRWHTVTSLGRNNVKMTLVSLRKGRRQLLLMLWESGPGMSGFSIGEDYETKQNTNIQVGML